MSDDPRIAAAVEQAARKRAHLYAPSVLRRAVELVEAVYQAGEAHGVERERWDWVTSIPEAAVDLSIHNYDSIPQTPEGAVECLESVALALQERGVPATRDVLTVSLDRTPNTPWLDVDGRGMVAVTITIDHGWALTHTTRSGRSRLVTVTAPHDSAGAAEVAELAIAVNNGDIANPFTEH